MLRNKKSAIKILNSKSQYLNPKQIINSNFLPPSELMPGRDPVFIETMDGTNLKRSLFGTLGVRIWDLFRISDFGFRIFKIVLLLFILLFGFRSYLFAQEEYKYDAKGKRDPFIQLVTSDGRLLKLDKEEQEEAKKGPLVIEGVIYDKHGRSYAIVNGLAVGVGDMVGDYQVLKVQENKVIFIKEGQTLEVDFKKED